MMKSVLREPLVHFFVLGAVVFGLFALFDDTPPPVSGQTITVTVEDARRLVAEFEATWRRAPTAEELDSMIAQYIREEIYVREAAALGLDEGDAIIRRRLQLKMEFLTEAGAQAVDPDDAILEAHLAAYPDRFARAPRVAFQQILLGETAGGATVTELRASLNSGRDPVEVARPSLLPASLPASPRQVVDGTFGSGFFDAVAELPVAQWAGPVATPFGQHLVRVIDLEEGGLPPLGTIRERVLQDWRATFAAGLREERFEAMRARYDVTRPEAAEVLGQ
jgi:hypothetical protein